MNGLLDSEGLPVILPVKTSEGEKMAGLCGFAHKHFLSRLPVDIGAKWRNRFNIGPFGGESNPRQIGYGGRLIGNSAGDSAGEISPPLRPVRRGRPSCPARRVA